MAEATTKVQKLVDENNVVVFSKSYCPYCRQSKATLDKLGVDYAVLELDKLEDGSTIQDALLDLTGQSTVPNTFIGKKHIGGNSDLQSLVQQGKLEQLLRDAGALST